MARNMNYKNELLTAGLWETWLRVEKCSCLKLMKMSFLNQYLLFRKQLVMKSHLWLGIIKLKLRLKVMPRFQDPFHLWSWTKVRIVFRYFFIAKRFSFCQKKRAPEFNSLPLNKCHNVTHNAMNLMSHT